MDGIFIQPFLPPSLSLFSKAAFLFYATPISIHPIHPFTQGFSILQRVNKSAARMDCASGLKAGMNAGQPAERFRPLYRTFYGSLVGRRIPEGSPASIATNPPCSDGQALVGCQQSLPMIFSASS
jgi:hypothetical protein